MIISSVSEANDMLITSHLGADSLPGLVQNCLVVVCLYGNRIVTRYNPVKNPLRTALG